MKKIKPPLRPGTRFPFGPYLGWLMTDVPAWYIKFAYEHPRQHHVVRAYFEREKESILSRIEQEKQYDFRCYFDGACEPINPGGHIGWGAYIEDADGKWQWQDRGFVSMFEGDTSNNKAEYLALKAILVQLEKTGKTSAKIIIHGDSDLVCKQMRGEWRIKAGYYVETALECQLLFAQFSNLSIYWIPRELNEEADYLSKLAISESDNLCYGT